MGISFLTDSGADLPKTMIEKHDIEVVPLHIRFGRESYKAGIDISNAEFYDKLRQSNEIPKSSSPSPHDFYAAYQKLPKTNDIIVIALSSGVSSTYESAVLGKKMLLEEDPNRNIVVIDSKTGSAGQILLMDKALTLHEEGETFDSIVEKIEAKINKLNTFISLETLENVVKGGRLSKTKASIANVLNIKILLKVDESGKIAVMDKIRGHRKARQRFIDQIGEYSGSFQNKTVVVTHSNNEQKGREILQEITEMYPFEKGLLGEMGPIIGTYAGEGGIVVSFFS